MKLVEHPGPLSAVRLPVEDPTPRWAFEVPPGVAAPALASVTRTREELSVVCATASVPEQLPGPVQGPFTAFEVAGPLDFALTGVLAGLLRPLADVGVSVFGTSTYDTDWVLVPVGATGAARAAWVAAGHEVATHDPDDPSAVPAASPAAVPEEEQ